MYYQCVFAEGNCLGNIPPLSFDCMLEDEVQVSIIVPKFKPVKVGITEGWGEVRMVQGTEGAWYFNAMCRICVLDNLVDIGLLRRIDANDRWVAPSTQMIRSTTNCKLCLRS